MKINDEKKEYNTNKYDKLEFEGENLNGKGKEYRAGYVD